MARRIRVPGIVDVVLVTDPAEIRALDEEPKVDRRFVARGPLVNRLITGRIRRWFHVDGQLLPSLVPRGDAVRAERQQALAGALPPVGGQPVCSDTQLDRLASFVRGASSRDDAAVAVQEIVGKLFHPDYEADQASWKASELIDRFRDGFSPVQILWLITGRLRRARRLLLARARQDRWAMHGTAIGMHGILHALERMRDLRASSEARSLGDDAVLARCLAPPRQVPRTVEAMLSTPVTGKPLRPGTLVMLRLGTAGPHAPDAEMVFMHGHWNACPAQAFVTELLRAAWRRSSRENGRDEPGHHLHAVAVP
jgi:hypothetical protein